MPYVPQGIRELDYDGDGDDDDDDDDDVCDSVNHVRFLKDDHLPDWARRDNQVKKGDRLECVTLKPKLMIPQNFFITMDFYIGGRRMDKNLYEIRNCEMLQKNYNSAP